MKTRFHPAIILMILYCLAPTLRAQENRETGHACFRLENERTLPFEMEHKQPDTNLYNFQFIWMKEWAGKQVFVSFPASDLPYPMIINGFRFSSDQGSGVPSEYNITPFLNKQSNTLELLAETAVQGFLLIRDGIHVRDLLITKYSGAGENEILVSFQLFIKSYLKQKNRGRTIHLEVKGPGEEILFHENRDLSTPLSFGQETELNFEVTLKDPVYWFPGAPSFYELKLSLDEKGKENPETIFAVFDVRSCQVNDSLFIQNGDSVQLVFASWDLATVLPDLPEKEVCAIIEKLGINAVRSEAPLSCEHQELYLRQGILPVIKSE